MTVQSVEQVVLPTGVRLQYVEQGEPHGIPVLLLHGWSDSWRSFEPVLPYLPGDLRAIALTQRGHGDADRPQSGYVPRDLAADAVALLGVLDIERALVVGHSMGAWVAERIAVDWPERVRGLVLAGALGPVEGNPVATELFDEVLTFSDPIDPGFVAEFQRSTIARPLPDGQLEVFVAESLKMPARVWRATAAAFRDIDVYADAAAIAAPALVIWGDRDDITPRDEQDRLVAAIPQARLRVYEGTGHALHWEEPARFAADVAAFATGRPAANRAFAR
jgi:non-heme chloroperoxidase